MKCPPKVYRSNNTNNLVWFNPTAQKISICVNFVQKVCCIMWPSKGELKRPILKSLWIQYQQIHNSTKNCRISNASFLFIFQWLEFGCIVVVILIRNPYSKCSLFQNRMWHKPKCKLEATAITIISLSRINLFWSWSFETDILCGVITMIGLLPSSLEVITDYGQIIAELVWSQRWIYWTVEMP